MKIFFKKPVLTLLFIGILSMVACKKEKQFSCDPEINSWAKENADRFQVITREQLATLPIELAQAAYRTLSPEKKFELWNEKFDIVYTQWDAPVRKMIDDARTHMSIIWFDPESGAIDKDYLESWENIMLTEWMDSTNYYLSFCTIYTEEELNALEYSSGNRDLSWVKVPSKLKEKYLSSKTQPGDGGSKVCTCKYNFSCGADETCTDHDCNHTIEGCGWAWLESCQKKCEPKISWR
jgi:hypothetical protein